MRRHRVHPLRLAVLLCSFACASAGAQATRSRDSVRVLRFQPDSAASPVAPVVITFDRPVAPNLDESIEPESALAITPARAHRTYWRDPSTLVAEFDAAWPLDASYEVRLAPALRAAGLPFARRAPWPVRIQSPRVLAVLPAGAPYDETGEADTRAHLHVVWSGAVPPATLGNRLWFVPTTNQCSSRDSVPMTVVSTRRITATDPYSLTYAGGYDRDQRLDSLRRVVEVRATSVVPRGCVGVLRTPPIGTTPVQAHQVRIVPRFVVASVHTRDWNGNDSCAGSRCQAGPIIVSFSQSVTRAEVVEHVRIDGRPARVPSSSEARDWILDDTLHAGVTTRITIDASIRSRYGERLATSIDTVRVGRQSEPALGIATGQVVLPARAPYLLRVRYASTDSVRVVIGRVADSLRSRALAYGSPPYERIGWSRVVADSVVHVMATRFDSLRERVLDIPPAWVPERWRGDPLFLVRAVPIKAAPPAPRPRTGAAMLPAVAVVDEGNERREPRFAVVQHSDLVAHAARHGDEVEVWVTRRASAEPVRGARVALFGLRGRPLGAAITDTLGVAHVTGIAHRNTREALAPPHLEVMHGSDRVMLAVPPDPVRDDRDVRDGAQSDSAPVSSAVRGTLHGAAFSDRGIYRPGERVYVKGVARNLRSGSGYMVPAGDSVRWTLSFETGSSHEIIVTRTGRLGEFGTHSDSLELPSTARVGWYRAAFEVRDRYGWRNAAQAQFAIAEYRVPEFAVRATVDTSVPVYAGDSATVRVAANYLFGPPMAYAVVKTTVSTSDEYGGAPSFPSLKGYQVGRSYWLDEERPQVQEVQPAPMKLGADGSLVMRLPSRAITRPGLMSISVSVEDASRQAIAASTYVPIRAADAFIGIRTTPQRWDWSAGEPIPIELLAVRGDGVPRAGTLVRLEAHRITWSGARWKRDTTWRDSVTSGEQAVRASFTPTVDGWYEIVASIRDERGRVAESGVHLGVMGASSGWPGSRGILTLKLDDREVNAGDTLGVIVEAPADLMAWVTVRNEGTPWQQVTALKRGLNVLRVPVPQGGVRLAQLHVVAVRPVTVPSSTAPSDVPYFYHENTLFWVSDSARVLRVGVTADRARYQPGDTVRVAVSVADHRGRARRSELAVWAVDQGVVSLSGFQRPSLVDALLRGSWEYWWLGSTLMGTLLPGPPGLGPLSFDEYADFHGQALYERADARGARSRLYLTAATASGGKIPAPGDSSLRHRFATTPFFAGTVTTDSSGRAATSFVLPDNVTTYRLFAVAVDGEVRTGSADTTIVSARPLVVRAALPRVVRTGDSLFAGAVLTREGGGAAPVQLDVRADGLRIDGATVAHDTLHGVQARERRFPMRVHADDSVVVRFGVATAGERDAVQTRLLVSAPGRPRAHVAMGSVLRTETVELDLPEDLDLARSRLVLQTGSSPLPLLRQLDERLRVYPYACTEQVSSAARALIARVRLERALGAATTLAPTDRKRLELAVNALLDRQRRDGGIGYWSAQHWTTPWLTAYALDALLGARELGVAVPQAALDSAAGYFGADSVLGDYWRTRWLNPSDSAHYPREALHAARLLRKLNHPDTALETKVYGLRARLDFEDRLTLAMLLAARGDSARARAFVDAAWGSVRRDGRRVVVEDSMIRRRWLFRSVTGTNTSLLRATAALRPRHPLLGALLETVLQSARSDAGARWNTTDQSAVAEAIAAAIAPLGLNQVTRLSITDTRGESSERTVQPRTADSVQLALDPFISSESGRRRIRVQLASPSDTPVYYALTLHEVPVTRPMRPDEQGIAVERWYERYEDGKPITEVVEGELVRVRLRITAPRDREFVVVDDPLPAGLEAVDQSLRTTGSLPPYAGAPRLEGDSREGPVGQKWLYGSWDGGWWTPWEHKEMRDDRVLWFARQLWRGSYQASYVARATTAGRFVRPPAQAEEMYNPAVHGRSEGGVFSIRASDQPAPNR